MSVQWAPGMTLEQLEKNVIEYAMRFYNHKKEAVASVLGISLRTLHSKLTKYEEEDAEAIRAADKRTQQEAYELHRARYGTKADTTPHPLTGASMEPACNITPQHIMPVPKRPEVQEVLSESSPKDLHRKRG